METPLYHTIDGQSEILCFVENDSTVQMLEKSFGLDNSGIFHRVSAGGIEGFMPAANVWYGEYQVADIQLDPELRSALLDSGTVPLLSGEKNQALSKKWMHYYANVPGFRDSLRIGVYRLLKNNAYRLRVIRDSSAKYGVYFPGMVAKTLGESNNRDNAVSRCKATGCYQFMFATACMYNLARYTTQKKKGFDHRRNFEKSTGAACHYTADLEAMVRGWKKELPDGGIHVTKTDEYFFAKAAYNFGPGNVKKYFFLTKGKYENYPDKVKYHKTNPGETMNYGPKLNEIDREVRNLITFQKLVLSSTEKTPADIAFEGYKEQIAKDNLSPNEAIRQLDIIAQMYLEESHSDEYRQNALMVLVRERQKMVTAGVLVEKM